MIRFTRFAAALLTASLVPVSATAQLTPTPTMQPGSPCSAVVTYQWDVTSIDHLTGVRWELKDAPFTNPDGGDPGRIASEKVNEAIGSVEIDLREFGSVLDGSAYYFRVIGRGGGVGAPPSEAIVFDPTVSLQGQVSATGQPGDPTTIEASWNIPDPIAGCADVLAWGVLGPAGQNLAFESEPLAGGGPGGATASVPPHDSYQFVLGTGNGETPQDGVGEAVFVPVELQQVSQPTPTASLQPGASCPAAVEVSWDVTSIPGAEQVRWRLRSDGVQLDSDQWSAPGGTETIDLGSYGSVLDGTAYEVEIRAQQSDGTDLADWSAPAAYSSSLPAGTIDAYLQLGDPYRPQITWQFAPAIAACAGELGYEVAAQQFQVPDGDEPGRLEAGVLAEDSGSELLQLAGHFDPDEIADVWIRPYARNPAGHEVGVRGEGESVTLGERMLSILVFENDVCGSVSAASGVTVTASGEVEVSEETNADGLVRFPDLPEGAYTIVATTASGCQSDPVTTFAGPGLSFAELEIGGCPPSSNADLALSIEGPDSPLAGQPFDLQVTVASEEEPTAARDLVVLREPAQVSLSSLGPTSRSSGRTRTRPAVVGEGSVATLCPGEAETVAVTESGAPAGDWVYRVELDGGRNDDTASTVVTVTQPIADLNPSISQTASEILAGATQTYQVAVHNEGTGDASDVILEAHISENLEYVSSSGTGGFSCLRQGLVIRCYEATVPAGGSATVTIVTSLPASATAGHPITFGATADPEDEIAESDENDNAVGAYATTAVVETATYAVTDVMELLKFAKSRGYNVLVQVDAAEGFAPTPTDACTYGSILDSNGDQWMSMLADGGTLSIELACRYDILVPKPLAEGWSLQDVTVVQSPTRGVAGRCLEQGLADDGSGIRVTVLKPAGPSPAPGPLSPGRRNACWLKEIELSGPVDSSWKDAFE